MRWPRGSQQQGQSCSDCSKISSATGQGLKAQRQDYVVKMFPHRGVWVISVSVSLPSHLLYCYDTGLTSKSLEKLQTSQSMAQGVANALLSIAAFSLEFACCECTFFKSFFTLL